MKRYSVIILAVLITLAAVGCNQNGEQLDIAPIEVAQQIVETCGRDLNSFTEIHDFFDAERLIEYVENKYGIIIASEEDISIYSADMPDAFEIAVFTFSSNEDATNAVEKLTEYISAVEKEFAFYEPEQAYIAHNSISVSSGRYVALLICEEPSTAKETFENVINGK